MVEQTRTSDHVSPRVAGFEKRGRLHAAIKHVRFLGSAEHYLPDVLQGNAGIGGKSNGCLLRISPALPEIVAGSKLLSQRRENTIPAGAVMKYKGLTTIKRTKSILSDVENRSDRE